MTLRTTFLAHSPLKACITVGADQRGLHHGRGKLCLLICAGGKDPSDHARMSTIQSSRPQKSSNTMKR